MSSDSAQFGESDDLLQNSSRIGDYNYITVFLQFMTIFSSSGSEDRLTSEPKACCEY